MAEWSILTRTDLQVTTTLYTTPGPDRRNDRSHILHLRRGGNRSVSQGFLYQLCERPRQILGQTGCSHHTHTPGVLCIFAAAGGAVIHCSGGTGGDNKLHTKQQQTYYGRNISVEKNTRLSALVVAGRLTVELCRLLFGQPKVCSLVCCCIAQYGISQECRNCANL